MDGIGVSDAPVTSAPLIPGFQDFEPIGSGDFATVYSAKESVMGREVAIKIFSAPAVSPDAKRRFERECKAIGALAENPNIVTLYGTGTTADGRLYVVMDLMTGGSLSDRLRRVGALPASEVATVGVGLAAAIQAAHQAGVLHRDIDPNNVLISRYGRTQLADFGITPSPSTVDSGASHITETIGYVAPEVIDGRPASPSSDVYSLAATLITMITGKPPFAPKRVETLPALVARLHREPPPSIVALGASPELEHVLHRALEKTPEARFDSPAAFGAALAVVPEATSTGAPARSRAVLNPPVLPMARAEETYPSAPIASGPVPPPVDSFAPAADLFAPAPNEPVPAPLAPVGPAYEDEFFSAAPVEAPAADLTAPVLDTGFGAPTVPFVPESPLNGVPRPSQPSEPIAESFFGSPAPSITPPYVDGPTVARTRALDVVDPLAPMPSAPVDYSHPFGYADQRRHRLRIGAMIAAVIVVLAGGGVAFASRGHKKPTTPTPTPSHHVVAGAVPAKPTATASCVGFVCTFKSPAGSDSNATLHWVASNGHTGTGNTFQATFKGAGAYFATVTAVNGTTKSAPFKVSGILKTSTRTVAFDSGVTGSHALKLTTHSANSSCQASTAQLQQHVGSGWKNVGAAEKVPASGIYNFTPGSYGTYHVVVAASSVTNGTCAAKTSESATTRAVQHHSSTSSTGTTGTTAPPPASTGTTTPPAGNTSPTNPTPAKSPVSKQPVVGAP